MSVESLKLSDRQGRHNLLKMLVLSDTIEALPASTRIGFSAIGLYEMNDPQGFANSMVTARELTEDSNRQYGQEILNRLDIISTAIEANGLHANIDPQAIAHARSYALQQCVRRSDVLAAA